MSKNTNKIVTSASSDPNHILECRDLRISFMTNNGTVKAVRGLSFDLYRGRTLAIVGESGSGKSVTSKAIMGILAGNKIIEDGHIFFDGHDLLRLSDRDMSDIRGSRISMIFQDPMSSLNPIMRVGKQMTEALILKNKSVRTNARQNFNKMLKHLKKEALLLLPEEKEQINEVVTLLKKSHVELTEEQHEYAIKIANVVGEKTAEVYLNNVNAALETVLKLNDAHLTSYESFNASLFKKDLSAIKNIAKVVSNPFSEIKDDLTYTLHGSAVQYLKKLRAVTLQEEKDARTHEKALAKGEPKPLSEKEKVKRRSFGSEFTQTPEDLFKLIQVLFGDYIMHLRAIQSNQNSLSESLDGALIIDKIKKFLVDKKTHLSNNEAKQRAISILEEVGIQDAPGRFKQYPFELSGGMRQRIVIAIALLADPDILICDEPTTALDVTIQAQILDLINEIKRERNLSIIFITHNLGVVANMADDVAVMYAGKIVEYGGVNDIFYEPKHPYTWALLSSMPDLTTKDRLESIPGTPPNMIIPPKGDAFAARNSYALKIDFEEEPPLFKISDNHYAATWLLHENAPKVKPPKVVLQRMEEMRLYQASLKGDGGKKDGK